MSDYRNQEFERQGIIKQQLKHKWAEIWGNDQGKVFSVSMGRGEDNLGKFKGIGKVQTCIARIAKQDAFILLRKLV